jgi:hypothetical protein
MVTDFGKYQRLKYPTKTQIEALVQTTDGGFALAGYTGYTPSPLLYVGPYHIGNMWLVKTDAKGVAQWNQTYEGAVLVSTTSQGTPEAGTIPLLGALIVLTTSEKIRRERKK